MRYVPAHLFRANRNGTQAKYPAALLRCKFDACGLPRVFNFFEI